MREIAKYIITLTIICIAAAAVLAGVYNVTKEPIAISERQEKLRAIKMVLPPFSNEPDKEESKLSIKDSATGVDKDILLYAGRDEENKMIGVAIENISKTGYGGDIKIMMGVDMNGEISGIYILDLKETPGLGSKIKEDWFKEQFKRKSLSNSKLSVKKDGGDIDAITGATISSRAVAYAIEEGLKVFEEKYLKE